MIKTNDIQVIDGWIKAGDIVYNIYDPEFSFDITDDGLKLSSNGVDYTEYMTDKADQLFRDIIGYMDTNYTRLVELLEVCDNYITVKELTFDSRQIIDMEDIGNIYRFSNGLSEIHTDKGIFELTWDDRLKEVCNDYIMYTKLYNDKLATVIDIAYDSTVTFFLPTSNEVYTLTPDEVDHVSRTPYDLFIYTGNTTLILNETDEILNWLYNEGLI